MDMLKDIASLIFFIALVVAHLDILDDIAIEREQRMARMEGETYDREISDIRGMFENK